MDALSELLKVVRLSGGVFLEAFFTAPWCIRAQIGPEDCRHVLSEVASVVAFHYVLDGRMLMQLEGAAPVEVTAGSVVLLPRNDVHMLASDAGLAAVDADALVQMQREGALARIDHGGGGAQTRIVCGFVATEMRRHPLLDALPQFLVLDLKGRPEGEWVASSFRFAAQEVAAAGAGSETVLARLSELLFVEAVRGYLAALPAEQRGWLAGLRDPAVGRALALMHARVAHPWTADALAAEALLSRSAFAERFTMLVGVPPISYLTTWRMQVAGQSLRESRRSIAQQGAEAMDEGDGTDPGGWARPRAALAQALLHRTEENVQRQGLHGRIGLEVVAQALGHRQHPLTYRQRRHDVIGQMRCGLHHAPGIARGAHAVPVARAIVSSR